jgi:hypothetical protein
MQAAAGESIEEAVKCDKTQRAAGLSLRPPPTLCGEYLGTVADKIATLRIETHVTFLPVERGRYPL